VADQGQALRRAILLGAVAWSLLTSLIFAVVGASLLMAGAYDAARMPPGVGVLFISYAIFLMAFAAGILKERPWAWYAGFVAAGVSVLLGIHSAVRHSWGPAAFDVVYGAALAGVLLWCRKAGRES